MHMGCWKDRSFIQIQILRNYNWNDSPTTDHPPPPQQNNGSQHKDDEFEIGKLNQACWFDSIQNAHQPTRCLYCVLLNCFLSSRHVSVWEEN